MNTQITDRDIEILCATNPLASEQLRRIVAERQNAELIAELAKLREETPIEESNNGVATEAILAER